MRDRASGEPRVAARGPPRTLAVDAGYGSEQNYARPGSRGAKAAVKHPACHREQKAKLKADPAKPKGRPYDEAADAHACGFGRRLSFVCGREDRGASATTTDRSAAPPT